MRSIRHTSASTKARGLPALLHVAIDGGTVNILLGESTPDGRPATRVWVTPQDLHLVDGIYQVEGEYLTTKKENR